MVRLNMFFQPKEKDPYSNIKPTEVSREFYLEESKLYEYIPKEKLAFDATKRLLIFESKGLAFKFLYMPKLLFPILGVSSMAFANAALDFTILIALVYSGTFLLGAALSVLGCRIATDIYLHEDGKNIDVTYKMLNLVNRTATHSIKEFKCQYTNVLMHM